MQVLSLFSGKLNSSLNRSLSSSTGPAPSSTSRPTTNRSMRRSTVNATAVPLPSNASRRSLSTQARKPQEVENVKATRSTPLKRAPATPLQVTPAKRVLEKTASVPTTASARTQSGLKTKCKPEALILPAPSGGLPHGDGKMVWV